MSVNDDLAEALRLRQINLLRHQVSVRDQINGYLDTLTKAIVAEIISVSPSEPARDLYRQGRVDKLIEAVSGLVSSSYKNIKGYHLKEMASLADAEAFFLIGKVNELIGKDAAALDLSASEALSLVKTSLMSGATLPNWWDGQDEATQRAFEQQMRIGVLSGETDQQLINRVRGTAALSYKDGIMETSRRSAKILVRGASAMVSTAITTKAVLDNPDEFEGIQQISVLDGRTSATCISYAGKVWSLPGYKPVGHSLPYNGGVPRHPNCRSKEIPVLNKSLGGAPAHDVDFGTFLEGKSDEFTDQLLGKGRAKLYEDGKITLSDLVDQQGRPLTLEELKSLH
ncbi:hypothetical protein QWJ07_03950 [Frankia sp. RB7]|nr:hypothetical protein [Frankia sp. RB7]